MEEQLGHYFEYPELHTVVRILGLGSTRLASRLAEIDRLERDLYKQKSKVQRKMLK